MGESGRTIYCWHADEDCEELSTYLLSQLYANKGEQKRAIQLIDDAIVKFPQVPYFHFEKIKYLLDLERYEEMLAVIDNINTQSAVSCL